LNQKLQLRFGGCDAQSIDLGRREHTFLQERIDQCGEIHSALIRGWRNGSGNRAGAVCSGALHTSAGSLSAGDIDEDKGEKYIQYSDRATSHKTNLPGLLVRNCKSFNTQTASVNFFEKE
jgi:hypothetical protein